MVRLPFRPRPAKEKRSRAVHFLAEPDKFATYMCICVTWIGVEKERKGKERNNNALVVLQSIKYLQATVL